MAAIGATAVMVLAAAVVRIVVHRDRERDERAGPGVATPAAILVLASTEGVSLVRPAGDAIRVSTAPATVAYGVGPDLVAFQDEGEGPVKAGSEVRSATSRWGRDDRTSVCSTPVV